MISEFAGKMIQPIVENELVGAGETVTLKVTDSTYVGAWSVDNDNCTIENGVLNIGKDVAIGATITVTVTGLDGTVRSINVYVAKKSIVELGNLGDLEINATQGAYSIALGEEFDNVNVTNVLVEGTALPSEAWSVSNGSLIITRTYLAGFYGEQRTISIVGENNDGVNSEFITATAELCIITKIIRTLDDLNNMKNYAYGKENVTWSLWGTNYTEDAWTGYYVLGGNITLSGSVTSKLNSASRTYFNATKLAGFYGTLDGRGYVVTGGTYNMGGVLGHGSKDAVVKNIAFKGVVLGAHQWSSVIAVSYWGTLENVLIEITADNRANADGGAVVVQAADTLNAKNVIVYDRGGRSIANATRTASYINHKGTGWGTHENVYVYTDYYVVRKDYLDEGSGIATIVANANVDTSKFDSTIWDLTGTEAKFVKETTI